MKLINRLAAVVRNLPSPLNAIACRWLSDVGLMSPWNGIYAKLGCPRQILHGIFSRMHYAPVAHGSALLPKLLGTYEMELEPFIREAIATQPDIVVDIGSAEGYYAVGLAVALPEAEVHAFDINPLAHRLLLANARLNGVPRRIKTWEVCTADSLQAILQSSKNPFVISDCEGYELDIFNLEKVPDLARCSMIVEVHEHNPEESATDLLHDRFNNTHSIRVVSSATRTPADWPLSVTDSRFSEEEKTRELSEGRLEPQEWMIFVPKG